MPSELGCALIVWCALMNLVGIILAAVDKRIARKNNGRGKLRRVPEKTLLTVGALGGALGMFLCMLKIRHKTRKKRFMIGLPLMVVWHIGVAVAGWYLGI